MAEESKLRTIIKWAIIVLIIIAFSLAILAFGKLERQAKVDKKRKSK